MRKRQVQWIACLALVAAGCGGQLDTGPADDDPAALKIPPIRFATPDVSWQFSYCLDADHRAGLAAAMLDLSVRRRHWAALPAVMAGAVADSQCIEGQERGGLFRGNPSPDARALGLQFVNIRPTLSERAFSVTRRLINDVAAQQFAALPQRFDDAGTAAANGRYAITGYTVGTDNDVSFTVVDSTNGKSVSIDTHGPLLAGPGERIYCGSNGGSVRPWRDDNPLVQTVINATNAYLKKNYSNDMLFFGPTCVAVFALSLDEAPSLAGWPLPWDNEILDLSRRYVAYGGQLVR